MEAKKKDKSKVKEYSEAEMGRPDLKLIILGDTAVGKSKYALPSPHS